MNICPCCGEEYCGCDGNTPICPTKFDELRDRCLSTPVPAEPAPEPWDV